MEIPASARGAESSWTLAPDLSDREGQTSVGEQWTSAPTNAV